MTEAERLALILLAVLFGTLGAAFHILPLFLRKRVGDILGYINLGVHIILFALTFLLGASFDVLVLILMASVCIFSLTGYIRMKRGGQGE